MRFVYMPVVSATTCSNATYLSIDVQCMNIVMLFIMKCIAHRFATHINTKA